MKNLLKIAQLMILASIATLWGCSSESGGTAATAASAVQVISSSSQLQSGTGGSVTLLAYIKDGNNNLIEGEDVTFSVDLDGTLAVVRGITDSTGTAEATLSSPTNSANRTLTVSATAGSVNGIATVAVTGATIQISGSSQMTNGDIQTLTIIAEDGSGNPVAFQTLSVTSVQGNTLSSATVTTDAGGNASVNVTGDVAGVIDVITVAGLGISTAFSLSVSDASSFSITIIDPGTPSDTDIELVPSPDSTATVTITWFDSTPAAVVGGTVNFTTTRGTLSAPSCVTNGAGQCSVTISSTNAGPANIVASTTGPSTSTSIEFISVTPDSVNLQADKVSLATGGDTATLTAVVRDATSNFVKGATVEFSLILDTTAGSISPATAVTDSLGRASTIYTTTAASSAQDGVEVEAKVQGFPAVTPSIETLTVADQQLFITLGTSHLLGSPSDSVLTREFGVFVTDAYGNAANNISIQLGILPLQPGVNNIPSPAGDDATIAANYDTKAYRKGYWQVVDVAGTDEWVQNVQSVCNTEDADLDGILDTGEDLNSSTDLDPGNVAFVPGSVTTDTNGYATFNMTYFKNFAYWASVTVTASAEVAGTESIAKHSMLLTGIGADYADVDSGVPGQLSPFGVANDDCSNQY